RGPRRAAHQRRRRACPGGVDRVHARRANLEGGRQLCRIEGPGAIRGDQRAFHPLAFLIDFYGNATPGGTSSGTLPRTVGSEATVRRCREGRSCSFRSTPSNASAMTENSSCTGVTRDNQDSLPFWC